MKTKRKASRLGSCQPEQTIATPQANHVNPPVETHITCSVVTTKTVEPRSSAKKTKFDNVIVRRSQRIRNAVPQHPMIRDADLDIHIIDHSDSDQDELRNSAQLYPDQQLNHSPIEDIATEPQNQHPAGSEKGTEEDNDRSENNCIELESEEQMNFQDKPEGPKNKSEMQYRTMYFESQKKLQKLTRANNELSKKVAVAQGKLEVYEKGSRLLSSIIDKTKDLYMASALSHASDQAFPRAMPRAKPRRKTSPASKRKKPVASLR